MNRPTLISSNSKTPPRAESAQGASERQAGAADFGSWLTHDLRAKGAPRASQPPAQPAVASEPRAASAPQTSEREDFARWLTADLRPRQRPAPDSLAPQEVTVPGSEASASEASAPAASEAADDLVGARLAAAAGASAGLAEPLEEDDLAVLPGRAPRRQRSQSRRRSALAIGTCFLVLGIVSLRGRSSSEAGAAAGAAAAAPPAEALAVLPPPPPSDVPLDEEEDVQLIDVQPAARAGAARGPSDVPEEPGDPIQDAIAGVRGPNVGRFPDLPLRKLSELARKERELARQRDEALRRAAKRKAAE